MTYEERKKKLLQLAKKKRVLTPNESWIDPGSSSAHRVSLFADRLRREGSQWRHRLIVKLQPSLEVLLLIDGEIHLFLFQCLKHRRG